MRKTSKWTAAAVAAVLLASCATPPPPVRVVQVARPVAKEAPYRWTQGNAPAAYKQAVALFGPLNMRPGEYRWVASIPKTGETKVVIDLLTSFSTSTATTGWSASRPSPAARRARRRHSASGRFG
jgi:hypothetical protein